MTTTFNIGQMTVTIEDGMVKTSHPNNAMKSNVAQIKMAKHIVTGSPLVVLEGRGFEKNQSEAAIRRIKKEILKMA